MHRVHAALRHLSPLAASSPAAAEWPPRDWDWSDKCAAKAAEEGNAAIVLNTNMAEQFERCVHERSSRILVIFKGVEWTYTAVDRLANRIAHVGLAMQLSAGSAVALVANNSPEYIAFWLGMAKIGARSFLVQPALRGDGLLHCLRVSAAKHVVFGPDLLSAAREVHGELQKQGAQTFVYDWTPIAKSELGDIRSFAALVQQASDAPVPEHATARARGVKSTDPVFFIYTSGTTGLPKASLITHARLIRTNCHYARSIGATANDRIYCCLPLCHGSGTHIGFGSALYSGATFVLAERFSAARCWDEIRQHKCTIFQYIGELCRYLLAGAPAHEDSARENYKPHSIRLAVGNGLSPDLWPQFQQRFRIPRIAELYGATEGTVALFNVTGKTGAVGWMSRGKAGTVKRLVRMDEFQAEPLRDPKTGFCIECDDDEPGEFLGLISNLPDGSSNFRGYSDAEETKKKILRDVFAAGDAYFRSGDLLKYDKDGFVYFIDRIGDTFRWKGENVSTSEVAQVLLGFERAPGQRAFAEVTVYGVRAPSQGEGRVGMALLVPNSDASRSSSLDAATLASFAAFVNQKLPHYARPAFLRVAPRMQITITFKQMKARLQSEGFDLSKIQDALFVRDGSTFKPMTPAVFQDILDARVRI